MLSFYLYLYSYLPLPILDSAMPIACIDFLFMIIPVFFPVVALLWLLTHLSTICDNAVYILRVRMGDLLTARA